MTALQKYIDNQQQQIEENLAAITTLQQQLNDLTQQVRIQQQINQAQKTCQVEVNKELKSLDKLFKDLCGIYPPDAIDDLVSEIQEMAETVKDNYSEYAQSGRFLKATVEEEELATDIPNLPIIVESLPPEDDDTISLNPTQIQTIIQEQPETVINFIKQQLNISAKAKQLPTIATKIAEIGLTHQRIRNYIKAAELMSSSLTLSVAA